MRCVVTVGKPMICQRCGRETLCKNGNQRYCDECKVAAVKEQNTASRLRRNARAVYAKAVAPKSAVPSIAEIDRKAREKRMSYGKYVALYGGDERVPLP